MERVKLVNPTRVCGQKREPKKDLKGIRKYIRVSSSYGTVSAGKRTKNTKKNDIMPQKKLWQECQSNVMVYDKNQEVQTV